MKRTLHFDVQCVEPLLYVWIKLRNLECEDLSVLVFADERRIDQGGSSPRRTRSVSAGAISPLNRLPGESDHRIVDGVDFSIPISSIPSLPSCPW